MLKIAQKCAWLCAVSYYLEMVGFSFVNFVLIELAEAGAWVKKFSNGFLKLAFNRKGWQIPGK